MSDVERQREESFCLVWPILAFVLGAICDVLASAGKFDALVQLLLLPVALVGFVTAIVWACALIYNACRGRWKRIMLALAAVPAAFLAMPGLWSDFDVASEVRLIVNRLDYNREIAALSDSVGQRRTSWYWGGNTTAMTGGELYTLVYDETAPSSATLCSGDAGASGIRPWCGPDRSEKAWRLWSYFYIVERTVR